MLLELVKIYKVYYSNTTFVKVKYKNSRNKERKMNNSNTTFVKVKSTNSPSDINKLQIQIQHLLKLNLMLS